MAEQLHDDRPETASPEMRLLIHCARSDFGGTTPESVLRRSRAEVDADRLIGLADYHRLAPLLHRHLRIALSAPDDALFGQLRTAVALNARRMLQLTAETIRLVGMLGANDIACVPYKGPALAQQLYGSPTLRQAGDIDLLVRRKDVRRARRLLAEHGYMPATPLSSAGESFMIDSRYHEPHLGSTAIVELHWGFTNRDVPLALDLDVLERRLIRLTLGGHEVPAFAPDDLLLILCVHGAKHGWCRLEWIVGVATLLRSGDASCEVALEHASRLHIRRMLLLGLALAHDLLDAPVSPDVLAQVRADAVVMRLSADIMRHLLMPRQRMNLRGDADRFRLLLRERWRDRMRFLLYRAMTPSDPARWAAIEIAGLTLPLHFFMRPWHLIVRIFASARQAVAPTTWWH